MDDFGMEELTSGAEWTILGGSDSKFAYCTAARRTRGAQEMRRIARKLGTRCWLCL